MLCQPLLVIILVTIDDVLGISQIRNRIEGLLFGNVVTPAINIYPASEDFKKVSNSIILREALKKRPKKLKFLSKLLKVVKSCHKLS